MGDFKPVIAEHLVEEMHSRLKRGRHWSAKYYLNKFQNSDGSRTPGDDDYIEITASDLRDVFMRCDPGSAKLSVSGLRIVGGDLDLDGFAFPGWIVFRRCVFEGNLKAKHARLGVLYIRRTHFQSKRSEGGAVETVYGVKAPGLILTGGLRFGDRGAPSSAGYIDLRAAEIGGDVVLEEAILNGDRLDAEALHTASRGLVGQKAREDYQRDGLKDEESDTIGARDSSVFYARGAKFNRGFRLKRSRIYGVLRLTDASIAKSFQITASALVNPENRLGVMKDAVGDVVDPPAYAINADRMSVGGRFSTETLKVTDAGREDAFQHTVVLGKIRMHGAKIKGAIYLTGAVLASVRRSGVALTGASIDGSISFSHSLILSAQNKVGVASRRVNVAGDFFLQDDETPGNTISPWAEFSRFAASEGLNRSRRQRADDDEWWFGWRRSDLDTLDDAATLYNHYANETDHRLNKIFDAEASSDYARTNPDAANDHAPQAPAALNERGSRVWIPNGLLLDGASIEGRLAAKRAVLGHIRRAPIFDEVAPDGDPVINGFDALARAVEEGGGAFKRLRRPDQGDQSGYAVCWRLFMAEADRRNRPLEAIGAERIHVKRGVYLAGGFISFGKVNFRRANVTANLSFRGAQFKGAGLHYKLMDLIAQADPHADYPNSYQLSQTLNIGGVTLKGNLDLQECLIDPMCEELHRKESASITRAQNVTPQRGSQATAKTPLPTQISIYASRAHVDGAVFCNNGFSFRGIARFQGAVISRAFAFEPVLRKEWQGRADVFPNWRLELENMDVGSEIKINLMLSGLFPDTIERLLDEADDLSSDFNARPPQSSHGVEEKSLLLKTESILSWLESSPVQLQHAFLTKLQSHAESDSGDVKCIGHVDLTNATCKSYSDDFHALRGNFIPYWRLRDRTTQYSYAWGNFRTSWPDAIVLDLEGFSYGKFSGRGLDTRLSGITRIKWLQHQYATEEPEAQTGWIMPILWWLLFVVFVFNIDVFPAKDASSAAAVEPNDITMIVRWLSVALFPFFYATIKVTSFSYANWPLFPSGASGLFGTRIATIVIVTLFLPVIAYFSNLFALRSDNSLGWIIVAALPIVGLALYRERRTNKAQREPVRKGSAWSNFKSQPWLHCAQALRNSGREESARRVRLSRERLILHSKKIYYLERIFRALLLLLFGRGLVRTYPLMWFAFIYLIAWQTYHVAFESNLMRPSEPLVLSRMEEQARPAPPLGYATPRAQIFAFEKMTPGMPYLQENRWAACAPQYIKAANETRDDIGDYYEIELCAPRYVDRDLYAKWTLQIDAERARCDANLECRLLRDDPGALLAAVPESYADNPRGYLNELTTRYEAERVSFKNLVSQPVDVNTHCNGGVQRTLEDRDAFRPTDTSWLTCLLQDYAPPVAKAADRFFEQGGVRMAGWIFLSYGWLLVAGFAISISRLLLNED